MERCALAAYARCAVEEAAAAGSMNAILWYGIGVLIFAATPSYSCDICEWMYICQVSEAQRLNFLMVESG